MKKEKIKCAAIFRGKLLIALALLLSLSIIRVSAQVSNEFTYQGKLNVSGTAANGTFDMSFTLENVDGVALGDPVELSGVTVTNGIFTVSLDYGSLNFDEKDRYLKIEVRQSSATPTDFTELAPRQKITPAPTALFARTALFAPESGRASTSDTSQNSQTLGGIAPTGFIQNTTTTQSSANFNISGDGTAGGTLSGNAVNTVTQYNFGGNRILGSFGTSLYAGFNAGSVLTGIRNSFFGVSAGSVNTNGRDNSFFGMNAGFNNTTASANSFFGSNAGSSNTTGSNNTFSGASAGFSNTTSSDNSFFGSTAGLSNTGSANNFFGSKSGNRNTTGSYNSFFGTNAGMSNTTGNQNVFIGYESGKFNTTGGGNSFVGSDAGYSNTTGNSNAFFGDDAGGVNSTGNSNSFTGALAGGLNTTGSNNSFTGSYAGFHNISGNNNTIIGNDADVGSDNLTYAAAVGSDAIVRTSNTIVLGRENGSDKVRVFGLGSAGSTALCRNTNFEISTCSSSLRYKTNVAPFGFGLSVVNQLRPISFDWKEGGMKDVGFGAEDVAKINPLFVSFNDKGEVEGVKYDRLSAAFVNAFKEQQNQIKTQKQQIEQQQKQIDALTKFVCSQNPQAEICRESK